ncbi:hypothetical protein ACFV6F_09380 [Kitasatospora phosalacinea]|uniref:hypothetical protein n=1 Tax=Kitasatospora phosalacinea TaxID=2065 RepID=UPI00365583D3
MAISSAAPLSLKAFQDLCTLCEALVLLDEVQAIDAVDRQPSALAERLEREGLFRTFRPTLSRDQLRRLSFQLPEELVNRSILPGRPEANGDPDAPLFPDTAAMPTDLDDLVAQVDNMVGWASSGETGSDRAYRSNGYLITAAAHGLDYFPDFERAGFTAGTLRKVYRSLPMKLYERVAASLDEPLTGADVIAEWSAIPTIPIPPVSALVLGRAASPAALPEAILGVRADFARYRRYFADFKVELSEADTIAERSRLRRKYQALLKEASGENHEAVSLSGMLNLTENAVKAAASPAAVTSYGALLLTQPIDWIHRWWRRRPLAILFRMDSKLPRLDEYRTLVAGLWGDEAAEQVLDQAAALAFRQQVQMARVGRGLGGAETPAAS